MFFGVDADGRAAVVTTTGNADCHVILRGGRAARTTAPDGVGDALASWTRPGCKHRLVIDASHGNSGKDHVRQAVVASEIAAQVAAGQAGIAGVMLESFLVAGPAGPRPGAAAGLRPERHRRLHGLGHHGRGARHARRGGDRAPQRLPADGVARRTV